MKKAFISAGWLAALPIVLGIGAACANDSSAELSTGGLVLTKSAGIELRAEDLFISTKEIRVQGRFYNNSSATITTLVTFPMPDITIQNSDDVIEIPVISAPENFLEFSTKVNGQPVSIRVEQKVFAKGVDRTDVLRRLDVPLAPYLEGLSDQLSALPAAAQKQLLDLGMVHTEGGSELYANWTLKTSYYWEQPFPPGETVIEHYYRPSVGVTLGTTIGDSTIKSMAKNKAVNEPNDPVLANYRSHIKTYCIDANFEATAAQMRKSLPREGTLAERRISYILTTGSNWAGPIKSFRLVVDKEYADNIISFCGDNIRKTGPTTLEMVKNDFKPSSDLSILILTTHLGD